MSVKQSKKSHKNVFNTKEVKKRIKKLEQYLHKYKYIFMLSIPFFLIDIFTKILGYKIHFYGIIRFIPILFTILWIFLVLGISLNMSKRGKTIYIISFIISLLLFLVNNIYYSMMNNFFDFGLILMASEGSSYFADALLNCNILVYIFTIIIIVLFITVLKKYYPNKEKVNLKNIIKVLLIFILLHQLTPFLYGKQNDELTWSTWRNPRNIYLNFNDNNKSMMITGIYEYSFRNFYINFIQSKKSTNEEDLSFLEEEYNKEEEQYNNSYTGKFKDKNLIIIQLEGTDNWLLNEENTPTMYKMMQNSINFENHYSYYNGGGSTFNSEFAVNTGFITPLSYNQNAYTFNKNHFPYSLARLFKQDGYKVNAFHMNTSEYYSRGTNYKNWGYDSYNGLKDLGTYKDDSYTLDRELILNEEFNKKMFSGEKFVDYIIAYSNHLPFTTEKGVCKKLITEDILKEQELEELPKDYVLPAMTEEECAKRQAKETDYMVELLLEQLEEKELLDNTIITIFTDHYLYTLTDQTIITNYKKTDNNLINHTPFFIWDNGNTKKKISSTTSQLNILPTLINLFGLEYHPNYYLAKDSLDQNYRGYVFFSDYSWYDGNVYVDGGIVTNGKYIDEIELEDKNYYINYIIRKNDLTLKYDYQKKFVKQNENKEKDS